MSAPRPHAVLLCFACIPGAGSEEGVGWTWAEAAAEVADVTLVTSGRGAAAARPVIDARGLPITVRAVDIPTSLERYFPRKLIFVRYLIWQILAARVVRSLEQAGPVDVVHHVTWASDSLPSALLASRAPVRIWGPVGGATTTAAGLYRHLSWRGRIDQLTRDLVNGTLRRCFGRRVARHATLVVGLNDDVVAAFRERATRVVREANAAFGDLDAEARAAASAPPAADGLGTDQLPDSPDLRTAVFAARLIPWKGLLLAIRALAQAPGWRLVVAGEGPDRAPAEALAAELQVADRVLFTGRLPREDVVRLLRTADALLMPSFHDSAPWTVGEASTLGCPVVCLDRGGPAYLAGANAHVVEVRDGRDLAARLAAALDGITTRGLPDDRWSVTRLPALLDRWYSNGAAPDRTREPLLERAS